jgi:hypothetical protein
LERVPVPWAQIWPNFAATFAAMRRHGSRDRSDRPSSSAAKLMRDDERFDVRQRIQTVVLDDPVIIRDPIDGDASDGADDPFNPEPDVVGAHVVPSVVT